MFEDGAIWWIVAVVAVIVLVFGGQEWYNRRSARMLVERFRRQVRVFLPQPPVPSSPLIFWNVVDGQVALIDAFLFRSQQTHPDIDLARVIQTGAGRKLLVYGTCTFPVRYWEGMKVRIVEGLFGVRRDQVTYDDWQRALRIFCQEPEVYVPPPVLPYSMPEALRRSIEGLRTICHTDLHAWEVSSKDLQAEFSRRVAGISQ